MLHAKWWGGAFLTSCVLTGCTLAGGVLAGGVLAAGAPQAGAASQVHPTKDHRWQLATIGGVPAALGVPCPHCPADIVLRCLARGRGLMQLALPGAAVANGRAGATKQIRLTFGRERVQRRALTERLARGYTPVIELAVDDPLLDHLSAGGVLKLNFYGQRRYVGLSGSADPIERVRAACRPVRADRSARHCIWAAVISCAPTRREADLAGKGIRGSFIRHTAGSHCVTIVSEDLASAKAHALRYSGYVERSCVR